MNSWLRKKLIILAMITALLGVSSMAVAQEDESWDDVGDDAEVADEPDETDEDDEAEEADGDSDEAEEEDEEADEDDEPFSPTVALGLETGFFFSDMARFNDYVLEPNDQDTLDVLGAQHLDLVAESEVLEHLRVSILGGMTFGWQGEPSLFGWYIGLEPAYTVGDDEWSMALGASAGIGGLRISADDEQARMSLVMLRPFLEVRRQFSENLAGYLRGGFNQWYPGNARSDTWELEAPTGAQELGVQHLSTGGPFIATGFRFGALDGLSDPEEDGQLEATDTTGE